MISTPLRRVRHACTLVLIAYAFAGCSSISALNPFGKTAANPTTGAADPTAEVGIDYKTVVTGAPKLDEDEASVESLIEGTARLYKLAERPPASIAMLKRRAAGDVDAAERVLRSEGFYKGKAAVTIDEAAEPPTATIALDPGARFTLGSLALRFDREIPEEAAAAARARSRDFLDKPARGAGVVEAEDAATAWLTANGWPYAKRGERKAEADFDLDILRVRTEFETGPYSVFGPVTVEGAESVESDYIAGFATWKEGAPFSRAELARTQRDLSASRLFGAVAVDGPKDPPEGEEPAVVPVTIRVEEGKQRSFGLGARYSTVDGPGVSGFWEHRNLLGRGEKLRFGADVAQFQQKLSLEFKKPRFTDPARTLNAAASVWREDSDSLKGFGGDLGVGVDQQFSQRLRAGIGLAFEGAMTETNGVDETSYLIGLPLSVTWDTSDSLLDPTVGVRAQAVAAPWTGLYRNKPTGFAVVDASVSAYLPLDEKRHYVAAVRGRAAMIGAKDLDSVPPTQRLYVGGGGSVRGYGNRAIGPRDATGDPTGGLSAAEIGAEMRMRFGSFGVVPFVEAGAVGGDGFSGFSDIQYGAGLGFRYYSPIGPIRFDVAVPINRRDGDGRYQVYFSIGQAF